ncbi:hypothetical protein BC830DRAFT_1171812 [Chytriomyces sp. MP71]|nr:hypothetical protein BC830DRAFT_1171812 [Chytriomyces sp. MP71]
MTWELLLALTSAGVTMAQIVEEDPIPDVGQAVPGGGVAFLGEQCAGLEIEARLCAPGLRCKVIRSTLLNGFCVEAPALVSVSSAVATAVPKPSSSATEKGKQNLFSNETWMAALLTKATVGVQATTTSSASSTKKVSPSPTPTSTAVPISSTSSILQQGEIGLNNVSSPPATNPPSGTNEGAIIGGVVAAVVVVAFASLLYFFAVRGRRMRRERALKEQDTALEGTLQNLLIAKA